MTASSRAFALVITMLGLPLAAYPNDEQIDEVLVTATRRAVNATEISAAISLIDSERLRSEKLLTDALANNAGVFLQQTTPGQGAAIIRGQKGSSILHLVDGMRLNNAIFRSAPTQYLSLVPITAVDRIEVLRGTPASLYGSDAVGGVVQLVTRVPRFDDAETRVRGDVYAGFDSAELGKTIRGTLDMGNSDVATSLSGEYLDTGDRRTGAGERVGPSGFESRAGRLLISITPDERRAWLFDVHYLEQPSTPRVDELVPGFGQTEPSSSEFFFAPNQRLYAHVRYELAAAPLNLDWRFDASWQRIDDDRITRNFQSATRRIESNRSDLSGITVSASRTTPSGSWIAGGEYYHDRVSSRREEQDVVTGQTQIVAARFPDGSSVDQMALFVNAERRLLANHSLSGGIRLTSVDVELSQIAVSAATTINTTDGSGDIGWRFDASESWQIVANIGVGFRAPNVFDLGTLGNRPGNRFNILNTSLDSEQVLQGDLGVRYHSDEFRFELMLYALSYDDRITSVLTGGVTSDGRDIVQSVNAEDSSVRGAEFGLDADLGEFLRVSTVVNYTWGEQTVALLTEPGDRIPPLSGRLGLTYANGGPFAFDAWARFANAQERLSARDVNDVRIDPTGTAGWGIVGASATWQADAAWTIKLGVDNLLDKRYRNHGSGIDAPGRKLSVSVRRVW